MNPESIQEAPKVSVLIASQGMPCDPPIVNGISFWEHEAGLWLGRIEGFAAEVEEAVDHFLRIPAFSLFGGNPANVQAPGDPAGDDSDEDPEADLAAANEAVAAAEQVLTDAQATNNPEAIAFAEKALEEAKTIQASIQADVDALAAAESGGDGNATAAAKAQLAQDSKPVLTKAQKKAAAKAAAQAGK